MLILFCLGASQGGTFVTLERSGPSPTCMNDMTQHRCTTDSLLVHWVVQPFVDYDNPVIFSNDASNNGIIFNVEPNITFQQNSTNPLVTVMTIFGCLNNTDVAGIFCFDPTNDIIAQSSFTSRCKYITFICTYGTSQNKVPVPYSLNSRSTTVT